MNKRFRSVSESTNQISRSSFSDVGARNERRFCAVHCSKTPGFEVIHGLLDRFMTVLAIKPTVDKQKQPDQGYHIRKGDGKKFCYVFLFKNLVFTRTSISE